MAEDSRPEAGPVLVARTTEDVREAVVGSRRVRVRAGGTKSGLHSLAVDPDTTVVDLSGLDGLVEYEPGEYTVTALAGTRVRDVLAALSRHDQTLPFDPVLVESGATLGGTVAAGVSGPGRYRGGGVRDFILGVQFVDGLGRIVNGGGKVVKNAAGFDLPKLMVGSLGRLGVMLRMTLKVFPRLEGHATLRLPVPTLDAALSVLSRLAGSSWDLAALDLVMDGGRAHLEIRIGGLAAALPLRASALRHDIGGGDLLSGAEDERYWHDVRELAWTPPAASLVYVPTTPRRVALLEHTLADADGCRRYSGGGQVAWITWQGLLDDLAGRLSGLGLGGLVVRAPQPPAAPVIGHLPGGAFARRVKEAMDPRGRFGTL